MLKVSNQWVWVWSTMDELTKVILGIHISFARITLIAKQFLKQPVKEYRKHSVSTAGSTCYSQACRFLNIGHHVHSSYQKAS